MKHYFKPYRDCNIFIETGTSTGDGVIAALNADFPIIHSIELSERYFHISKKLFVNNDNVKLYLGNSVMVLPKILQNINERCVFWLDAHWCGGPTAGSLDQVVLMDELKIIAGHHIKEHTVLIDDMRLVRDKTAEWKAFPYTQCDIEELLYSINSKYKITYGSGVVDDDVLIARI